MGLVMDGRPYAWSTPAPPEVLNFAWRLATNSLAIWRYKQKHNLETTTTCLICGSEEENSFHTFCTAHGSWMGTPRCYKDTTYRQRMVCLNHLWSKRTSTVTPANATLANLARTEWVGPPQTGATSQCVLKFLTSYVASLNSIATDPMADLSKESTPLRCFPLIAPTCNIKCSKPNPWSPPATGHVKLNTDISIQNGVAGTGMILRDHDGSIILRSCRYLFACKDVLETEILAIRGKGAHACPTVEQPINRYQIWYPGSCQEGAKWRYHR